MLSPQPVGKPTERRYGPRVELNHRVQIALDGELYRVTAVNLSAGGAFIETDAPLTSESEFTVSWNALGVGSLSRARVAWGNSAGFGIAFVDPPDAFQEQFDKLLAPLLTLDSAAA